MESQQPLVSVLMTAYNREQYIAEAIESVLASSYTNFELIIVDDCSSDATVNIAKTYEAKDQRIKIYVNEKNLGQFPNRNKAASYANGKYLKYLDSDDKILNFGLAYCVEEMEKYPEAGLGMYCLYSTDNNKSACWTSERIVREHFFGKLKLATGPSGIIIKRDKFIEIGGFDTRFGVPSDTFFNIKFASQSPVVLLPVWFIFYRRHEGQEINNRMDFLKYGHLYFKELLINIQLPLKENEIQYLYRKMQKRHSINLVRNFWLTKDLKKTREVMRDTNFSITDFIFSFFK